MSYTSLNCHCGAVKLAITGLETLNNAYRCDCSYCASRGAIMLAIRRENVEIVQGRDLLSMYQWGTNTAEHYFCKTCGIYTHHRRKINPDEYGLNVAALTGVNPRDLGNIPWPATSNR